MDLPTAIELVAEDTRTEAPDTPYTNSDAVQLARRELVMDDIYAVVADTALRDAYRTVLAAEPDDLTAALEEQAQIGEQDPAEEEIER
ncbi:hypothetical protein FRP1_28800 (plasmid) [Pseudonocardia sp. EC080625-04]|uniref:hypothetical protein n=1 Tax=Pseudonocardia sp. EC080625-04 TaxID=1096868 RepID=UPI0006CB644E|nr:hypothetical protein [Pseudonocardia sp. EC080625-04]ALE76797.1 hypothetical protein FRP1_28800 [Pseudonocardia sp. EC080625-04]